MATKICRLRHGDADGVIFDSRFLFAGAMTHRYLDDNFLRPGWEVNVKGRPVVTTNPHRIVEAIENLPILPPIFPGAFCVLWSLQRLLYPHFPSPSPQAPKCSCQGNKNNYGNCEWELTCNGGIFITFRLRKHGLLHNTFETIGANDKISFNRGTALL